MSISTTIQPSGSFASAAAGWISNTSKTLGTGFATGTKQVAEYATLAFKTIGNNLANGTKAVGNGMIAASKVAATGIAIGAAKIAQFYKSAFYAVVSGLGRTYEFAKTGAATGFAMACSAVKAHPNVASFTLGALAVTTVWTAVSVYNNRNVEQA